MFQHYSGTNSGLFSSSGQTKAQGASVGDSQISLDHGTHGKIAVVTPNGLKCDQDLFPKLTSKEFAYLIFECMSSVFRTSHFERGRGPVKWMICGEPVLEIGETSLVFNCAEDMSCFDQWVFIHLQKLWRQRKV